MNNTLIKNWNAVVPPGGLVYHLGDFAWGKGKGYQTGGIEDILKRLNGQIFLIDGSHDKPARQLMRHFVKILPLHRIKVEGQDIVLCHYCMRVWQRSHFGSWHLFGHCFSEDTELLTNKGFKKHKELKIGQKALTLNLQTNQLEYNKIKKIYVYKHFKKMIQFKNKSGEILVTSGHMMVRKSTHKGKLLRATAQKTMNISHLIIPINAKSKGRHFNKPPEFFTLLGLIISEGHFFFKGDGKTSHGIRICQKKENAPYIETVLKNLQVPYNIHKKKSELQLTCFYLPSNWVKQNIYPWIKSKNISSKLMNLRNKQFRAFLAGLVYGDGSIITRKKGYSKESFCTDLINKYPDKSTCIYYTGNPSLKDRLSHLCTLNELGTHSKFKTSGFKNGGWYIIISNRNHINFRNKFFRKIVPYNGKAWCASVDNETLVVRRNGFIFITGNSHNRLEPVGKSLDVGVDGHGFCPWTWEEIKEYMKDRPDNFNQIKTYGGREL